jgi:hypothetical protein
MKKVIILFSFLLSINTAFSQSENIETMLQKIAAEKNDNTRIDLINDMYLPVETSQMPMFNILGTPSKDKKIIIYDTDHLVPRTDLIKETLAWYDKYLGPVK